MSCCCCCCFKQWFPETSRGKLSDISHKKSKRLKVQKKQNFVVTRPLIISTPQIHHVDAMKQLNLGTWLGSGTSDTSTNYSIQILLWYVSTNNLKKAIDTNIPVTWVRFCRANTSKAPRTFTFKRTSLHRGSFYLSKGSEFLSALTLQTPTTNY